MPEGPEAHVMADDLAAYLLDRPRRLVSVEFCGGGKNFTPEVFRSALFAGKRPPLLSVVAVGKKVIFSLGEDGDPSLFVVSFLGMGGLWQLRPAPHTRMRLTFAAEDGGAKLVHFNDSRGTGRVKAWLDVNEALRDVGPDLLSGEVTPGVWAAALAGGKKPEEPVCMALVEPRRLSGIGNYLRADIMFAAGVAPLTPVSGLTEAQLAALLAAARQLMGESARVGGHSLKDYFRLDGSPGGYQPLVYGRLKCPLGHPVARFKDRKGRTCHHCPQCQK